MCMAHPPSDGVAAREAPHRRAESVERVVGVRLSGKSLSWTAELDSGRSTHARQRHAQLLQYRVWFTNNGLD